MNIVVFSKNRPAQLDMLLRSMMKNWATILPPTIIYKADIPFAPGYNRCRELHPLHCWREQTSDFRHDVLSNINQDHPCTVFLVDDLVFKAPFDLDDTYGRFMHSRTAACLSLRLWWGVNYSYMQNRTMTVPTFLEESTGRYEWIWRNAECDWAYPMSLDGHIFKTADLWKVLTHINFSCPNELEGRMNQNAIVKPTMMCYPESKVINIPANRVDTREQHNRSMLGSAESLNEVFLQGRRLKFEQYAGIKNHSVHEPLALEWA